MIEIKPPAFELVKASKHFPDRSHHLNQGHPSPSKKVLDEITCGIPQNSITLLLGPNGSGKTTLLKLLAGLYEPDTGSLIRSSSCALLSDSERTFYWRLTGIQNLDFFSSITGMRRPEFLRRIEEIREILDLQDLDARYQEYSAGMKQQLALARLMLSDAPIWLLDEPTKSLDPERQMRFLEWIKHRSGKSDTRTIILATHELHDTQKVAEHILILNHGKLILNSAISRSAHQSDPLESLYQKAFKSSP